MANNKKIVTLFIVILSLVVLYGCNNGNEENNQNKTIVKVDEYRETSIENIKKGKKGDKVKIRGKVDYVYNGSTLDNYTTLYCLNNDIVEYCEINKTDIPDEMKEHYIEIECELEEVKENIIKFKFNSFKEIDVTDEDKLAMEEAIKNRDKRIAEKRAEEIRNTTYDMLARTPDKVKGKYVGFTGKILQVIEGEITQSYRVAKDGNYGNVVYVNHLLSNSENERLLEGDTIYFEGTAEGLKSYTTVSGTTETIPYVLAFKIERK